MSVCSGAGDWGRNYYRVVEDAVLYLMAGAALVSLVAFPSSSLSLPSLFPSLSLSHSISLPLSLSLFVSLVSLSLPLSFPPPLFPSLSLVSF